MNDFTAITYIGKKDLYIARVGGREYEFEWRKSLGVGNRAGEVRLNDALVLTKYRDRRGKKIFQVERISDILK